MRESKRGIPLEKNWSDVTAAADTSSKVDGLVRLKCRRKLITTS